MSGEPWRDRRPLAVAPPLPAYLRGFSRRRVAYFHAPAAARAAIREGVHQFYNRLVPVLREAGFEPGFLPWQPRLPLGPPGRHLHVNAHGRWPGMERLRLMHTGMGYLRGHWYWDDTGYRWSSGIGARAFDAKAVDGEAAQRHFRALRERFVFPGVSFHAQAARGGGGLPEGAILALLQSSPRPLRVGAWMDEAAMLSALDASRDGRPLAVKRHPNARNPATEAWLAAHVAPARGVHLVEGNLHDLLRDAAAVACINSGAGFEALLHRRPVLLFGRSDYHHCAETVRRPEDTASALARALERRKPHARYVHWFLSQSCLDVFADDFEDRALREMADWLRPRP